MKEALVHIFWSFVAYIILLKLSINLIGLVVRGFYEKLPTITEGVSPQTVEILKKEYGIMSRGGILTTLVSIVLTIAFFYALYHFWNIGLAVTAGIFMVCRLPDLLWEIKTGKRVSKTNPSQWKVMSNLSVLIMLLCLPLTWYCLFRL